jgi:bla regulator protein blaR1
MIPIQSMIEWAVRSSILILAGSLLVWLLRVKSPSIRQIVWTVMLAGSLAIPLLTTVTPKVRFDIGRAPSRPSAAALDRAPSPHEAGEPRSASPDRISAGALPGPIAAQPFDWIRFAAILYAGAAGALMLRLLAGLVLSYRILRRSRLAGTFAGRSPVRESGDVVSPVTIGVLRPAIVLPLDWRDWDPAKLDAVMAHERSHIRRRDPAVQLLSAAHRALLWVNPLSWFLHRNLVRTAEEISDDDAIGSTQDRVSYAEILLEFVQRGVGQSSLPGIPMASYDRPEKRIRRVLNSTGISRAATRWSVAAILAMGAPLAYLAAAADPQPAPQSSPKPVPPEKQPKFEVASIKPAPPQPPPDANGKVVIRVGLGPMPGGGLRASNITLKELIAFAYRLDCYEECRDFITGGSDWMDSSRYDIQARAPQPPENLDHLTAAQRTTHRDQLLRQRVQALLADRFQLVLRRDTKAGQTYALRIAKNGHKLKPGTDDGKHLLQGGDQRLTGENATMEELAIDLQNVLGRPVTDKTGLAGKFNFKLTWSLLRDESAAKIDLAADVSGHSIFGALQSQLGLKLEPMKGPVTKLVVVGAERPSEN